MCPSIKFYLAESTKYQVTRVQVDLQIHNYIKWVVPLSKNLSNLHALACAYYKSELIKVNLI